MSEVIGKAGTLNKVKKDEIQSTTKSSVGAENSSIHMYLNDTFLLGQESWWSQWELSEEEKAKMLGKITSTREFLEKIQNTMNNLKDLTQINLLGTVADIVGGVVLVLKTVETDKKIFKALEITTSIAKTAFEKITNFKFKEAKQLLDSGTKMLKTTMYQGVASMKNSLVQQKQAIVNLKNKVTKKIKDTVIQKNTKEQPTKKINMLGALKNVYTPNSPTTQQEKRTFVQRLSESKNKKLQLSI